MQNIDKDNLLNLIFFPRKSSNPLDDNDLLINVDKDIKVSVRLYLKNKTSPTIILFHANAELSEEYQEIAEYYHHYNINLIVAGFRGYNHSNGTPSKINLHSDSLIIFDYLYKYLKDNKYGNKLIIMGRSLGSSSAAHIIHNRSNFISGCIVESGFATEFPLLKLLNINVDSINFKLSDGFENLKKFKNYKKPLFIIHGDLDDIVPISQADIILLECKSNSKNLFRVDGANHNNIIMIGREHYFAKIKNFIENI